MIEDAARRLAERIVAHAPEGWRDAVLAGTSGAGGVGSTGGYTVPGLSFRNPVLPDLFDELRILAARAREARGWELVSMEIVCRPSGEYHVVVCEQTLTSKPGVGGGALLVLDPDHRPSQPGAALPGSTAAPAGDPQTAVDRFRAYLDERVRILGVPNELPPPATEAAVEEAERRLGVRLPDDLRALYRIANGDADACFFDAYGWMPVERLPDAHAWVCRPPWFGWEPGWHSVVFDTVPADTVRRCGGHPAWIPFATGDDGNYLAVDLAPAPGGRPGQVVAVGRDYDDGPVYVAESITALLGEQLELMAVGDYEVDDDFLDLRLPPRRRGPRDLVVGGPDAVVPTHQAVHLNDAASPVDLRQVAVAPALRRLHLNRCSTDDLAPLCDLPVEDLRVHLTGGDLTPLTGHPHLAAFELGTDGPVDLAPLRTVPHLHGLDLSAAVAPGLGILAELPGLRYLSLDRQQWAELFDRGQVPGALAAVRLTEEDVSLDEALAWAARFGHDTTGALRSAGTVAPDRVSRRR